jgi:hypothetical protein
MSTWRIDFAKSTVNPASIQRQSITRHKNCGSVGIHSANGGLGAHGDGWNRCVHFRSKSHGHCGPTSRRQRSQQCAYRAVGASAGVRRTRRRRARYLTHRIGLRGVEIDLQRFDELVAADRIDEALTLASGELPLRSRGSRWRLRAGDHAGPAGLGDEPADVWMLLYDRCRRVCLLVTRSCGGLPTGGAWAYLGRWWHEDLCARRDSRK